MNTELLKSIIVLNKDTQGELANHLGTTPRNIIF